MPRYKKSKTYEKRLGRLTKEEQSRVENALDKFRRNPPPPSLAFKKMSGLADTYEISPSRKGRGALRIVMRRMNDDVGVFYLPINVGHHKVVDRL